MKRILFFILSFVLFKTAFSQQKKNPVVWGIKAGVLAANAGPDYTDDQNITLDYQSRLGIVIGGRAQINAGKNFSFLPELTVVGKGANVHRSFNNGSQYEESPALSSFIELTANLLLKTGTGKGNFFIGGGPSLAFNLDEYSTLLGKNDVGINALAGYQLPIGFSFEINFNKGLKKQIPEHMFNTVSPNLKTSSIGFSIGYFF